MPNRELVERVLGALNVSIGRLHGTTRIGAIALTIRDFQDLWRLHVEGLVATGSPGWRAADWVLQEAERRNLRETACRIVARFGEEPGAWSLSSEETRALLQRSGWDTEQEAAAWGRQAHHRLIALRDAISERMESEWA